MTIIKDPEAEGGPLKNNFQYGCKRPNDAPKKPNLKRFQRYDDEKVLYLKSGSSEVDLCLNGTNNLTVFPELISALEYLKELPDEDKDFIYLAYDTSELLEDYRKDRTDELIFLSSGFQKKSSVVSVAPRHRENLLREWRESYDAIVFKDPAKSRHFLACTDASMNGSATIGVSLFDPNSESISFSVGHAVSGSVLCSEFYGLLRGAMELLITVKKYCPNGGLTAIASRCKLYCDSKDAIRKISSMKLWRLNALIAHAGMLSPEEVALTGGVSSLAIFVRELAISGHIVHVPSHQDDPHTFPEELNVYSDQLCRRYNADHDAQKAVSVAKAILEVRRGDSIKVSSPHGDRGGQQEQVVYTFRSPTAFKEEIYRRSTIESSFSNGDLKTPTYSSLQ